MSIQHHILVWCDHPGCRDYVRINTDKLSKARRIAKKDYEWRRAKATRYHGGTIYRDLCPQHAWTGDSS